MTDNANNNEGTPVIFDGWRSMTIACSLSLIGYSVMGAVPIQSTALVVKEGFTDAQVGKIWACPLALF